MNSENVQSRVKKGGVIWSLLLIFFTQSAYSENATITCPTIQMDCSQETQWDLSTELLLLKADQIATWSLKTTFRPFTTPSGSPAVDFTEQGNMVLFDWDFGFRIGIGRCFDCDQWDTQLYYTWFRTRGQDRSIAENSLTNITSAPIGEWLTFAFASDAGKIQWRIHLDALDWEIGRNSYPGKGLFFRPFIGVKGGWIRQSILSQWVSSKGVQATENLKNDFWGLGPRGGVNSRWELSSIHDHCFYVFADTSLALLAGRWTFEDLQKTAMDSAINSKNPATWSATFMEQAMFGFGWQFAFKNQSNLGIRIGYELQYWFDQLKIFTFLEGTLHAALVLQGGILDVHFNF